MLTFSLRGKLARANASLVQFKLHTHTQSSSFTHIQFKLYTVQASHTYTEFKLYTIQASHTYTEFKIYAIVGTVHIKQLPRYTLWSLLTYTHAHILLIRQLYLSLSQTHIKHSLFRCPRLSTIKPTCFHLSKNVTFQASFWFTMVYPINGTI